MIKLKYVICLAYFLTAVSCLYAAADDSAVLNQKGLDELHLSHPERAVEYFRKAISADPGIKHYYNNLAAAYMRMGEYVKAEEQLNILLQIDCNYARALSNMSVTLFHLGRYSESYKYYLMAKRADSEYTGKRFDRKRVSSFVKILSAGKPDDLNLKSIKNYMESGSGPE